MKSVSRVVVLATLAVIGYGSLLVTAEDEVPIIGATAAPSEMSGFLPSTPDSGFLPSTPGPSASPSTRSPSASPSQEASAPPTLAPTKNPSAAPSKEATVTPTKAPSAKPSRVPTKVPSNSPSLSPINEPSDQPSSVPSDLPTDTAVGIDSPFLKFYSSLTGAPTEASLPPSIPPSQRPSVTYSPSTEPSASPNQQPSKSPSSSPTKDPSIRPTTSPSVSPTGEPSTSPSLPAVTVVSQVPAPLPTASLHPPTRVPTNHPTTFQPVSISDEHETTVTMTFAGISELKDPSTKLLIENTLTQLLSELITEMGGVPVFILKTHVISQSRFPGSRSNEIVLVEAVIHAVAVGGRVDDTAFENRVKRTINENKENLEESLRNGLNTFSGRLAGDGAQSQSSSDGQGSSANMVLVVAILVSGIIGTLVLIICCIAMARRRKQDAYEMNLKNTLSSFPSHPSVRSYPSKDTSQRRKQYSKGGSKTKSQPQNSEDVESQYSQNSRMTRTDTHYTKSSSQDRNFPPLPPNISGASHYSVNSRMAPPMEMEPSYSESISPCSTAEMISNSVGPDSQDEAENVELVEIEDEDVEGWAGTKVAAITGGKESVQKAEMLCQHTFVNQTNPSDEEDTVLGNTTVLNDLVLSETTSTYRNTHKLPPRSPSRSKSLKLSLWRKARHRVEKAGKDGDASGAEHTGNRVPENLDDSNREDFTRDRSKESQTQGSLNPDHTSKRTASSISNLTDAYSLSTCESRSGGASNTTRSSGESPRTGSYTRGSYGSQPMYRRQSMDFSDNYSQSRTRSTATGTNLSYDSSDFSESGGSNYSSDDSESISPESHRRLDESRMLKLKGTVSTAAFSRTHDNKSDDRLSDAGSTNSDFVRKMTMSGSHDGGPQYGSRPKSTSSGPHGLPNPIITDVASMFGFTAPP